MYFRVVIIIIIIIPFKIIDNGVGWDRYGVGSPFTGFTQTSKNTSGQDTSMCGYDG